MLGRILYYVPYYSPIHPGRVLTTFAALSMLIEALNGTGSSYASYFCSLRTLNNLIVCAQV